MSKYDGVKDKKQAAMELLKSPRGDFIISRALLFALERFKSVEGALKEESDIDDMELLLNELFRGAKDLRPHLGQKILTGWGAFFPKPGSTNINTGSVTQGQGQGQTTTQMQGQGQAQ